MNTREFENLSYKLYSLRGLCFILAILFQFIFFKDFSQFLITKPNPAFYFFFALGGFQYIYLMSKLSDNFTLSNTILFIKSRIFKIFPALIIWLLIANLCSLYFNSSNAFNPIELTLEETFSILTFQYNIQKALLMIEQGSEYFTMLGTYWHINFEEQVYLLLIVLMTFSKKLKISFKVLITIFTIMSIILFNYLPNFESKSIENYFLAFSPTRNFIYFSVGGLIAVHYNFLNKVFKKIHFLVPIIFLLLSFTFFWIFDSSPIHMGLFIIIFAFTFSIFISSSKTFFDVKNIITNFCHYIGYRFYAIYLGHAISIRLIEEISFRLTDKKYYMELPLLHALINSFFSIILILILGEIIHRLTLGATLYSERLEEKLLNLNN